MFQVRSQLLTFGSRSCHQRPSFFLQSTIGLIAFLLFGTQADVVAACIALIPFFSSGAASPDPALPPRPPPAFLRYLFRFITPSCESYPPAPISSSSLPPPAPRPSIFARWRRPPPSSSLNNSSRPSQPARTHSDGLGIKGLPSPLPMFSASGSGSKPHPSASSRSPEIIALPDLSPAMSELSFGAMFRQGSNQTSGPPTPRVTTFAWPPSTRGRLSQEWSQPATPPPPSPPPSSLRLTDNKKRSMEMDETLVALPVLLLRRTQGEDRPEDKRKGR